MTKKKETKMYEVHAILTGEFEATTPEEAEAKAKESLAESIKFNKLDTDNFVFEAQEE